MLGNTCKVALLATLTAIIAGGCNADQKVSDLNFDSAHTLAYDGIIDLGKILTSTSNEVSVKSQIREQLMYTIGQLNGRNGGIDTRKLESTIVETVELADGRFEVTYAAKLFVAWASENAAPADYQLILPARGDYRGLQNFYDMYGSDEEGQKQCLAWEAHEVSQGIFWYYYRPEKFGCSLQDAAMDNPEIMTRTNIRLEVSGENTSGKFPEFDKVWEDGLLVVTAIFGKADEGATSNSDAGASAFRQLYIDLVGSYGNPIDSNLLAGQFPGIENDDVRLVFSTVSGTLDVHLYLVDGIRSVGPDFRAKYNERTKKSDFVSYSGHSGLGANIRALARMGSFEEGQYQIFLVNGCDTFAYVDGALTDAHHMVNPAFGPNKFFDIITNAMPSYFHANSRANMQVIDGLLNKQKTYREILAGFDRYQRANVTGEEDNAWPLPFIEN